MKTLFTLSLLTFIFWTTTFSQEIEKDKDGYVNIPELSSKIKINGKAISIEESHFRFIPEYVYKNGIVFGSWIKLYLDGIEDVNTFEGKSLILTKERVYRKSDNENVYFVDWSFGDDGDKSSVELQKDEHLVFSSKLHLGTPIFNGEYVWELTVANFCNNEKVVVTVPFSIVQNPIFKTELSGGAGLKEVALWNEEKKYFYAGTEINIGKLEIPFYGIT
jgi:hypothetical protein